MCAWSDCFVCTLTGEPFGRDHDRLGETRLARLDRAEQLLEALDEAVADLPAEPDHHPLGPVPAVDERRERVAGGRAHRLLGADDVAAERLVAVEEILVDTPDEVARRVVVHVHLLDDDALLAVDLLRIEARVAQHVDEHVERDIARSRGALDVVAGVLLARERVELAADPVDLGRDVARGRALLRALEEHVLGEMGDATDLGGLVARARREHDETGDGLRLRHRRREHAGCRSRGWFARRWAPNHGIDAPMTLSQAHALAILTAVVEQAPGPVSVVVADDHGEVVASLRMDGAALDTHLNAQRKAYTAARSDAFTTRELAEKAGPSPTELASFDPQFIFFLGGVAAFSDGRRVGAVGVSGLPGEVDEQLALAAIRAAGLATP